MQQTKIAKAKNVYELPNTGALVNCLHKELFRTTKSALLNPIKNFRLVTWSDLSEDAVNKYLKLTPATALGHMNQKRQSIRYTRKEIKYYLEDEEVSPIGKREIPYFLFAVFDDKGKLYMDLTVKYHIISGKGNSCVMFCYS